MSDQAALLRAIIDEPDELMHRYVYADWLEEHGDEERAEFIRGQCRLDRFWPQENPFRRGISAYDLQAEFAQKWLAPFVDLGIEFNPAVRPSDPEYESPPAFTFRRGFVECLTILNADFPKIVRHAMPDLFALTPLLHLRLGPFVYGEGSIEASVLETFLGYPSVARLRTLNLTYNHLGEAGARALLAWPHLTSRTRIFFEGNRLTTVLRLALEARFGASISCGPDFDPNAPEDDIPF